MKITIVTQYFPPEVGAPQNRLYELGVRLQKQGDEITILTAMPNYPQGEVHKEYRRKVCCREQMNGLKVVRSWIYTSKSKSLIPRLLNYYSFVITCFFSGLFLLKEQDVLICESPPLFLGKSAWLLARFKNAKFVFNVSDLWPESAEKLGLVTNPVMLKMATLLEEFLYRRADMISGQTQGIVKNILFRNPDKQVVWFPNGVDVGFYNRQKYPNVDWRNENGFSTDDFIFVYAGIIGYAQGLDLLITAMEQLKAFPKIKMLILGSGPEKARLEALSRSKSCTNIVFMNAVSKEKMPHILMSVNASVVPLRKLPIFKGAIPSKIFENLAMQVPVLLGVDGEARQLFVEEGKCALYYEPENAFDLVKTIKLLVNNEALAEKLKSNGLAYVKKRFERNAIALQYRKTLLSIVTKRN